MGSIGKIERNGAELARAMYRFISRNEVNQQQYSTVEERLLDIVDVLGDAYEADLADLRNSGAPNTKDWDFESLYPKFMSKAEDAAKTYNDAAGHGYLCAVPSFAFGLVLANRIWRHYKHASWFKVDILKRMLLQHGAVSKSLV